MLAQCQSKNLPPVDQWQPDRQGEIDIRIRRDGIWLHNGTEIRRKSIARVFSTILRREENDYFLVTPVEKLRIEVDDVPFVAVDMEASGVGDNQSIVFRTNLDDAVLLSKEHWLSVRVMDSGVCPYVLVRDRLEARLLNEVFYRLADFVEDPEAQPLALWSEGTRFIVS